MYNVHNGMPTWNFHLRGQQTMVLLLGFPFVAKFPKQLWQHPEKKKDEEEEEEEEEDSDSIED